MGDRENLEKTVNSELLLQHELLKVILEQNHERIIEYDTATDTMVIYHVVNDRFVEENSFENYVAGCHIGEALVLAEDRPIYEKAFCSCLKKANRAVVDIRFVREDEEPEWNRLCLVSIADENKQVTQIAGRFASIQKEKVDVERMRRKAERDELTGVYNHKAFEEKCEQNINSCEKDALFLMLDVDDFKMINDSQGHAVGDRVLAQTGEILSQMVEGHGIAGRMGGDEFAAFVCGFNSKEEMVEFCQQLRAQLKTITFDMEYSESIGVSIKHGRTVSFQDMYFEADQAVYAAKNGGKNQVVFFDDIEDVTPKETGQQPEMPAQYESEDDSAVLEIFGECVQYMNGEDYSSGIQRVQERLREFFDADCVVLAYWQADRYTGISECHRDAAEVTAKVLTETMEAGGVVHFRELINADGSIGLSNVKDIKETCPNVYDCLVGCRAWSVIGYELRDGIFSEGVLFVINPRKHISERVLLRMLADYLVIRLLRQQLLEAREYDATHDHLTRLWNRNSFMLWSDRWKDNEYNSMGIVTTDIVGLATLNRELGYLAGSKRLVIAANTLETVFKGYRVFRYDEDEMLVFCPNIKRADFMFLIKCLKEKLEELDFALALGYSWSNYVHVNNQITESEVVMGNDKLRLMHESELSQRVEQSVIEEVTRYIADDMYLIYLQPKVNVHTGRTVGAEALIRQMDSELGMVSPAVFIPVLERYNCIHFVDLFVLEEIFKYQKEAVETGRPTVPISVNFSKLTILQPDLIDRVRALTEQYEIPEGLITIEVTETVGDMDHVVIDNVANDLRTLGFSLSMDDFGTHYSNLAVLIQYDFDSAKIDRSMVMEITSNKKSRILLDYMTSLIRELGIKCVVEGIETKEQVDILKETKCDVVQGFFFGKPVPKEEFYEKFLAVQQA